MTKEGATILALITTFFYFIVCIVVMLVYKGESGVVETGNQFLIFLLVQAPRIIFLFGLTVFLLVLSALPIEKKSKNSNTTVTSNKPKTTTRTRTVTRTVKPAVKKIETEDESSGE